MPSSFDLPRAPKDNCDFAGEHQQLPIVHQNGPKFVEQPSQPIDAHLIDSQAPHEQDTSNTAAASSITPPYQASNSPASTFWSFSTLWSWIAEILALTFALLVLIAQILLLHFFDRHDPDNLFWKLNSIFAFLTALQEAALAFAIGSCLGQRRWLWFRKQEPQGLKWMDLLTNARTPSGAFRFALTPGAFRHWAFVGAVLDFLLLGVGVFTQNIIVQRTEGYYIGPDDGADYVDPDYDYGARVPVTSSFTDFMESPYSMGHEMLVMPVIAAVNSGFMQPASFNDPDSLDSSTACVTGNCTFTEYSSLSVCHSCENVSPYIAVPCPDGSISSCNDTALISLAGSNLTLKALNGYLNISSDLHYPRSNLFNDIGPLIAHYEAMGSPDSVTDPFAVECVMHWCVRTRTLNVSKFNFQESIVQTAE